MSDEANECDANGEQHGYWIRYYQNGQLWYKGKYIHGRCHGYWICNHFDGDLSFKRFYAK